MSVEKFSDMSLERHVEFLTESLATGDQIAVEQGRDREEMRNHALGVHLSLISSGIDGIWTPDPPVNPGIMHDADVAQAAYWATIDG
jgi:hypothetical protein